MSTHIMVDIETLGHDPDAAMIQLAAVPFEPRSGGRIHTDQAFNAHIFAGAALQYGTLTTSTMLWWNQQDTRARDNYARSMSGDGCVTTIEALEAFANWPGEGVAGMKALHEPWEYVTVWAKPSAFDLPIITNAFRRALYRDPPWDRRSVRDVRTLFALGSGEPAVEFVGVKHDALDDAVFQAQQVQVALGVMGVAL